MPNAKVVLGSVVGSSSQGMVERMLQPKIKQKSVVIKAIWLKEKIPNAWSHKSTKKSVIARIMARPIECLEERICFTGSKRSKKIPRSIQVLIMVSLFSSSNGCSKPRKEPSDH